MSQQCTFPAYREKREIECQTEVEDDFIVDHGEHQLQEDDDGLLGLLTLPVGFQLNKHDTNESLLTASVLKKNEFTICSRRLMRHTKVITPSKFAGNTEEKSEFENCSRSTTTKGRTVPKKVSKIICKKPPDIVYEYANPFHTIKTDNVSRTDTFGASATYSFDQVPCQNQTVLTTENYQYIFNQAVDNEQTQLPFVTNNIQSTQENPDVHVEIIHASNDQPMKELPVTNQRIEMPSSQMSGTVPVIIQSAKIPAISQSAEIPVSSNSKEITHCDLGLIQKNIVQNIKEDLPKGNLKIEDPHLLVKDIKKKNNKLHLISDEQTPLQVTYTGNLSTLQVSPANQISLQVSPQDNKVLETNTTTQNGLEVIKANKISLSASSAVPDLSQSNVKRSKNVHIKPKQQIPVLDLKKLMETLQSQGKDLRQFNHLFSKDSSEIIVNGQPLKFIVSEKSLDKNVTKTTENNTSVQMRHDDNFSKESGDIKDNVINTQCEGNKTNLQINEMMSASEIIEKKLETRQINAGQLKPNEYHEMIKDANRIIRSKENVNVNTDNSRRFKCDICSASFKRSSNLSAHKRIHSNDKRYPCTICDKRFYVRSKLQVHMRTHNDSRPYVCNICNKAFRDNSVLKNHMATHEETKQFQCEICDKKFSRKNKLDLHIKTHMDDRPYKCEYCGKSFAVIYYYRRHVKKHASEKEFKCDICNKGFHLKENYKFHLLRHDESKKKRCNVCSKTFIKECQLKNHNCKGHMTPDENSKRYKCDCCAKIFNTKSLLKIHQREHKGEKSYKCEICDKLFLHEYMLKNHIVVHSYKKPFKCTICNAEFGWASSVRSHIQNAHREKLDALDSQNLVNDQLEKSIEITDDMQNQNQMLKSFPSTEKEIPITFQEPENDNTKTDSVSHSEKLFTCPLCNLNFENEELLILHNNKHAQANNPERSTFICQICNEKVEEEEYDIHTLNHTKNTFSCKLCHQNFDHEQFLESHRCPLKNKARSKQCEIKFFECSICKKNIPETDHESHSLVHVRYPFTCSFCYMNFETEHYLQIHLEIHKGDKPYRCNLCGEKFASTQLLTSHRLIHVEEQAKPELCNVCGKRFPHKHALKVHEPIHNNERPYVCDVCQLSFARKDYLKKHFKKAHGKGDYRCVNCSKTFFQPYELKRHIWQCHLKDKPFSCSFCGKQFSDQYILKKHTESHNVITPFECSFCSNTFTKQKLLKKHLKTKHAQNPQMRSDVINKFIACVKSDSESSDDKTDPSVASDKTVGMSNDAVQLHDLKNDISTEENEQIVMKTSNKCDSPPRNNRSMIRTVVSSEDYNSHCRNDPASKICDDIKEGPGITSIQTEIDKENKKGEASTSSGMFQIHQDTNNVSDVQVNETLDSIICQADITTKSKGIKVHDAEPQIEIPFDVFLHCQNSSLPIEYHDPHTGTIFQILPPPKQNWNIENVMEIQTADSGEIIVEQVPVENEVSIVAENTSGFFPQNLDAGNQNEHSYGKANDT